MQVQVVDARDEAGVEGRDEVLGSGQSDGDEDFGGVEAAECVVGF